MKTYKILRYYADGRDPVQILTDLTWAEATAHCSDPETRCEGVWFDGFVEQHYGDDDEDVEDDDHRCDYPLRPCEVCAAEEETESWRRSWRREEKPAPFTIIGVWEGSI